MHSNVVCCVLFPVVRGGEKDERKWRKTETVVKENEARARKREY